MPTHLTLKLCKYNFEVEIAAALLFYRAILFFLVEIPL